MKDKKMTLNNRLMLTGLLPVIVAVVLVLVIVMYQNMRSAGDMTSFTAGFHSARSSGQLYDCT
jgi:chromate transport protein ChrA